VDVEQIRALEAEKVFVRERGRSSSGLKMDERHAELSPSGTARWCIELVSLTPVRPSKPPGCRSRPVDGVLALP
jgi:hypothetical protein